MLSPVEPTAVNANTTGKRVTVAVVQRANRSGVNATSTPASEKKVEHCGLREDFPCDYFLSTYDLIKGQWRVFYRAGQLAYRRRMGTRAWAKEKMKGRNLDPKYRRY
jgi:hypothetical protein